MCEMKGGSRGWDGGLVAWKLDFQINENSLRRSGEDWRLFEVIWPWLVVVHREWVRRTSFVFEVSLRLPSNGTFMGALGVCITKRGT